MKWTRTLDTWTAEAGGRRYTVRKRRQGIALRVDGGFVEGGFSSVDAAKKRARDLENADDPPGAIEAARAKAADADRRAWLRAAKRRIGPPSL